MVELREDLKKTEALDEILMKLKTTVKIPLSASHALLLKSIMVTCPSSFPSMVGSVMPITNWALGLQAIKTQTFGGAEIEPDRI